MKIGLDFDGVIANSHPLKAVVAKEKFGVDIPIEQFRKKVVVGTRLLTAEQYREVGIMAMNGSYPIPPVPDALLYLPLLLRDKHSVSIVTSRTEEMLESAKRWFAEYKLPGLPFLGTGYGLPKTKACEGLDIYVDDDLEKLLPLVGHVPNLLFFSWPWNLHEKEPAGITRVSCWWELYNQIRYEIQ
jgi:hypothetical protein